MSTFPPHLPPPEASVSQHRQWQRIKYILFIVFFGFISGVCGAAVLLSWIWPYLVGQNLDLGQSNNNFRRLTLDSRAAHDANDRLATIFRRADIIGSTAVLNNLNRLGYGLVVSSDGWLAAGNNSWPSNFNSWQVLFADGSIKPVVKLIYDQQANLAYLKVGDRAGKPNDAGTPLKAATFYDQNTPLEDVFIWQEGNWRHAAVLEQSYNKASSAHLDSAPTKKYLVEGMFSVGLPVVDIQGRFAGFMTSANEFAPAENITRFLPAVLSRGVIEYPSLGVDGWYNEETPILINGSRQSGFIVTRVWLNSVLKRGDVINEVNGQAVSASNWWYAINGNQQVNLKVTRGGKTLDLTSKVIKYSK